jgi:hypothetical protein
MLALLHAFLSGVARVIGRGSFGTVFSFFLFYFNFIFGKLWSCGQERKWSAI